MKLFAAVVVLLGVSAWAGDNCKDAAKNLSPLMALSIKGGDAKPDVMKATAADAEKRFATKCAAAPKADRESPVLACVAKAKTLGDFEKCKMEKTAPDKWADEVVAEMKK